MLLQFKKIIGFVLLLSIICSSYPAAAETSVFSTDYLERVPARFGHGFMNTVFGWTDLFIAPQRALKDGSGGGDAFGRALTQPFGTTFLGLWDLATFWVPGEAGRSMGVPRHVWMAPENRASQSEEAEQKPESDELALELPTAAVS